MKRSFLFLQGPHGPFLARLGSRLRSGGADVVRVNFSGGDWLDWHGEDAVAYRGTPEDWPAWVEKLAVERRVTDLVLYGDCRPVHRAAMEALKPLGVSVHVLEEGYLRPNWITCEKGGVNGHTSISRDPWEIIAQADELGWPPSGGEQVGPTTAKMVRWCLRHYAARWVGTLAFPRYRTHRPSSSVMEALGWFGRLCRRPAAHMNAERIIPELLDRTEDFYLLILQLDSDAQISRHSPFACMGEVIDMTIRSFARHAPPWSKLVIKNHPLDNGLRNYTRLTRKLAASYGVADRVVFLDGGRLPPLLAGAKGVVVVNSTAGLQALHHGCPTKVLGEAIYAIPGLVSGACLDDFWHDPAKPDPRLYRAFRAVVMTRSQYNGGFYTDAGMGLLLPGLARYLLDGARLEESYARPAEAASRQIGEMVEMLDELLSHLTDLVNALTVRILDRSLAFVSSQPAAASVGASNVAVLRDRVLRIANDLIRAIQFETIGDSPLRCRLMEICGCAAMIRRLLSTIMLEPVPGEAAPKVASQVSYLNMRNSLGGRASGASALEEVAMLQRLLLQSRFEIAGPAISQGFPVWLPPTPPGRHQDHRSAGLSEDFFAPVKYPSARPA
jgi:capsular polysaccharide export protein